MANNAAWKLEQAERDFALRCGEETAKTQCFTTPPVDPFEVIERERELIHAEGYDFGEAFDGRLSYVGPRFLLCYNTKYNRWPHRGIHHPKVRFSVGHELAHYYLEDHRKYLVTRRQPHGSFTEFASSRLVEQQADNFAAGLLMPEYLLAPAINQELDATMKTIKSAAAEFDVSLTSMMVRWVQLSHFPCATLCIKNNRIAWGFVSASFRASGCFRARREVAVASPVANAFIAYEPSFSRFREGRGAGYAQHWLHSERNRICVDEFYVVIPYTQSMMVFVVGDEDDLPPRRDDDK